MAGARLYADRVDMIESVGAGHSRTVAELGVALGDFSEVVLQRLDPETFVAVDMFQLHDVAELWGRSTRSIFGDRSHLEFYRQRFSSYGDRVVIEEGLSWDVLARYPDAFFDLVYIDAGHDYESVKLDTEQAVKKTKPDGVIVFNDYTMYDHITHAPYGVVPAVNELIVDQGWHVAGLALQRHMFCDIAVRRA